MAEYIKVDGLTKIYESGAKKIVAVDNVSFIVEKPEFIALLGPNGAGKTTLLNMIATILPPTRGKVLIKGIDAWKEPWKVKKLIGFVPQEYGVNENLTVLENMYMSCEIYGVPGSDARKRIKELMEIFGLEGYAKRLARKLSGGLKRRLSIAMSLVHDPEILILDEPTTGLDPAIRRGLIEMLRDLVDSGRIVIMSTHIGGDAEFSDRVLIMHKGRIIADDGPEELKRKTLGLKTIVELDIYPASKIKDVIDKVSMRWNVTSKESTIRVIVDEFEKETPEIIEVARNCGARVLEVRVRQPSLDDVFVKLTGYELGGGP